MGHFFIKREEIDNLGKQSTPGEGTTCTHTHIQYFDDVL